MSWNLAPRGVPGVGVDLIDPSLFTGRQDLANKNQLCCWWVLFGPSPALALIAVRNWWQPVWPLTSELDPWLIPPAADCWPSPLSPAVWEQRQTNDFYYLLLLSLSFLAPVYIYLKLNRRELWERRSHKSPKALTVFKGRVHRESRGKRSWRITHNSWGCQWIKKTSISFLY